MSECAGVPVPAGASEYNLLQRIIETLGMLPQSVLLKARPRPKRPIP